MDNKIRILFTPKATREIDEIINYIAINLANPKAANDLYIEFEKTLNTIIDFPLSGPISELPFPYKLHKVYFGNYIIFYNFSNDTITVFSIKYAQRNHRELL